MGSVDLFEYQARDLFERHGVPVLAGGVADTPEEARAAAEQIGPKSGGVVVVKAQVKTGGRGKAGGVKLAESPDEAAGGRRGDPRHGHQGPHRAPRDGRPGRAASPRSTTSPSCSTGPTAPTSRCAASEGGMEIEQLAVERPEALARIARRRDHRHRRRPRRAEIVAAAGFDEPTGPAIADVLQKLWTVYRDEDATLVEVNPLVQDRGRRHRRARRQGDARRQRRLPPRRTTPASRTRRAPTRWRQRAKEKDLNYVKLDGEVGIIGNGAGLVMSHPGRRRLRRRGVARRRPKPANFLDIGGGASAEVMANGLEIILGDPQVTSVFVNVFGGITACDAVANGIVGALDAAAATRRPSRSSSGWTATTSRRAADPRRARHTRW